MDDVFLHAGDKVLELLAGDAVFFPSDSQHRLSNLATTELELNEAVSRPLAGAPLEDGTGLVCGHFGHRHPQFKRLLAQLPSSMVIRRDSTSSSASIIELLLSESIACGQSSNLLLNRLSDCLFYLLLRDHLDTASGVFAALMDGRLSKAMQHIHDNKQEKISIDELASAAGMSRSAFSAEFKKVVGQSPIEYSNEWRMTQAYRWLADDNISTLEAAMRCGYESEASFSKAFKRVIGAGPGQVRRL